MHSTVSSLSTSLSSSKKTPLHGCHLALNARMVSFGGWEMPVEYSGVTKEHLAVRASAGIFDVSHMGEIEIAGEEALKAIQHVSSNDASRLKVGQAQYSALMTPNGTFIDDILIYRLSNNHFMLVVNAANTGKDFSWISEQIKGYSAAIVNSSSRYALIALQGPSAIKILGQITEIDLTPIKYYWFSHGEVASSRAIVSRTGYTGEDGFEIFVQPNRAREVWNTLLEVGKNAKILPCGLAARDTLRLEAAMRLYGNDIDETTSVIEAGLEWIISWEKHSFIGKEVLESQKNTGTKRRLAGFEMIDPGIARHGYEISQNGLQIGVVTSGTKTPYLNKAIGMAYIPTEQAKTGTVLEINIRGRLAKAQVVSLPFYKRNK